MKSYITGSQAYGEHYRDGNSDIDVVVFLRKDELDRLRCCAKYHTGSYKLQFGKLNLVAFNVDEPSDLDRSVRWEAAHKYLCENPPQSKEEAIAKFREFNAEKSTGEY